MQTKRIAVFGGSFNPPGVHHQKVVESLARAFDEVVVVPCGPRPDKQVTNDTEPIHRAAMADMAFRHFQNVTVDLFDLEHSTFTRTHQLQERYTHAGGVYAGDIHHVVGTDLVSGGASGQSFIQTKWKHGERIWNELQFVVMVRDDCRCPREDYPPNRTVLSAARSGSSTEIRKRVFARQDYSALVDPVIGAYIERHGLYRGVVPSRTLRWEPEEILPVTDADSWNSDAMDVANDIRTMYGEHGDANCIVVVGGDGTMLRAIRKLWHRRLPFIGINLGHVGFLMSDTDRKMPSPDFFTQFDVHHLPLLYVEAEKVDGTIESMLAFNEAWVERAEAQAAWVKLTVNGEVRISRMVADGALVSTAAGSTAYARAMGGVPIPATSPTLSVVGNNVAYPHQFRQAVVPSDSVVQFEAIDPNKRPIQALADGEKIGLIKKLTVRVSRIGAIELAFRPGRDMAAKLALLQFPSQ